MAQTPNVIGNVVIQRLRELDLPATPENYERFYYEVSGLPPPLPAASPASPAGEQINCKELIASLREMLHEVSEKTAHLTKDLGEKNEGLKASVSSLKSSREKNDILRLLSLVVDQAGDIHSTVRVSHTELVETRRALESMQSELSETRQMLNEDALTGTLNRRGLDQYLNREVARAQRSGEPLTLAMLDLDHFKNINDRYGHDAGDQMLVHFAALIKSVMRKSDAAVRYGGEEFVLVLPETDTRGAQFVLARLQQVFERTPLLYEGQTLQATFSAGIANLAADENGHALLRRADSALYEAKRAGRNCLRVAD
ncbi:MAG TPA: GGDEF domain-containing protein [Thiobacillaceae bacterium]|nr:GGDEF domain-containing protein [Thiobacillaceae bacterium]